jgi:hypothetical protein
LIFEDESYGILSKTVRIKFEYELVVGETIEGIYQIENLPKKKKNYQIIQE